MMLFSKYLDISWLIALNLLKYLSIMGSNYIQLKKSTLIPPSIYQTLRFLWSFYLLSLLQTQKAFEHHSLIASTQAQCLSDTWTSTHITVHHTISLYTLRWLVKLNQHLHSYHLFIWSTKKSLLCHKFSKDVINDVVEAVCT